MAMQEVYYQPNQAHPRIFLGNALTTVGIENAPVPQYQTNHIAVQGLTSNNNNFISASMVTSFADTHRHASKRRDETKTTRQTKIVCTLDGYGKSCTFQRLKTTTMQVPLKHSIHADMNKRS